MLVVYASGQRRNEIHGHSRIDSSVNARTGSHARGTVACKTGFTFTVGTNVLLRHTDQGSSYLPNHVRSSAQCSMRATITVPYLSR
jgi:hypothetical protein